MANLNIPDCKVIDPTNPTHNKYAFDGVTTNQNVIDGTYVAPSYPKGTLDLSTSKCAEIESNLVAGWMSETLKYAAGPVNVFPMLGVYNQGSTLDQPGAGFPISSGTPAGFNVLDAFNVNSESWRSPQTGSSVLSTPAYIGYNFGVKKAWESTATPQDRYFNNGEVRFQVSTIKIRQSLEPSMRATQIRVEASDNGHDWRRIDVINLPNTDQLVTVGVKSDAAYNMWRLIPTFFTGIATNQPWEVIELHLLESTQLSLDNVEDLTLLENRDRAYCRTSLMLKCTYDLLDVQSELARFGINLPQTYIFTTSFADMILTLGRPVVVGDIVEMPGEVQFDANLRAVRKWLEVTDTGWSTEGYTQNWRPNLFRFYAQPILPSIEHKDVLGVPGQVNSSESDSEFILDKLQNDQAFSSLTAIMQASKDAVPLDGEDPQDIQSAKPLIGSGEYDGNDLYAEDAIPPNGENYTVGDSLPDVTTISNGHYHRQTYNNINPQLRPPDRLLRWFADTKRWRVIEVNTRFVPESHKKTIASIMKTSSKMNPDDKL